MHVIDSLKQPEYTGENRCLPCTLVNVVIALAASVGVGWALLAVLPPAGATAAGAVTLAVCAGAIALRGYLVPGTPTLTKRYLPDRVLRWFDKAPAPPARTSDGAVDVEGVLAAARAVEPCDDVDDLCLTDEFAAAFDDAVTSLRGEVDAADAVAMLGLDEADVALDRHGDAVVLRRNGARLGQWESEAALLAEVAAAQVLADRYDAWTGLEPGIRSPVLAGLRLFVETCPSCGGAVHFGEETVQSCCREYEVIAGTCADCGARFFEADLSTLVADGA